MVRKKETKTRGETRDEFKNRAKKGLKLELKKEKSSLDNLKSESEKESEEEQYEIKQILDSKKSKKGKTKYLVKWSGTDENGDPWEPTWEPAKNIEDTAPDELKKFLKKQLKTPKTESENDAKPKPSSESSPKPSPKKRKISPSPTRSMKRNQDRSPKVPKKESEPHKEPEKTPKSVSDESSDEDTTEYEIEKIVDVRGKGSDKQYLVKWAGLNEKRQAWDDTWEPAEFIEKDGAEELGKFLAKRKESTSKRPSKMAPKSKLIEKSPEQKADPSPSPSEADQSSSSEEEEEFELEEIKKIRTLRGKRQYLVKWLGVDENGEPWADTWEPAENIEVEENENLLKKFRKKQANQKDDPPNKKVKKEPSKKKGRNKAGSDNETDYNPNSDSESKPKRKTAKSAANSAQDAQARERQKVRERLHNENIERQKIAAQAKKEILVLKPEILDQRKILDKGETALNGGQWAEALRLFKKADRIYSDNRSKGAIQKVEELLEEHERKLAEEKKEKEIQRQKYLNMTDDDRQSGSKCASNNLKMDQKRLSILCYQIFGKKYYKNTHKANYIEHITKSQVQEPIRKNPESPVQIETFEFFINLLNIPLPNSEDERIESSKVLLLTGKYKRLDHHQFDSLQGEIRKLVTKKIRKISRVLHPDKCRLKQSPWVDSSRDALAFINKGKNLIDKYLTDHSMNKNKNIR